MVSILWNVLLLGIAVFVVASVLPGIRLKGFSTAILVAIVYSVINTILSFFAFPFVLITLGLFIFVINVLVLWITDKLIDDFEIQNFATTILASLLITLCNLLLSLGFLRAELASRSVSSDRLSV